MYSAQKKHRFMYSATCLATYNCPNLREYIAKKQICDRHIAARKRSFFLERKR